MRQGRSGGQVVALVVLVAAVVGVLGGNSGLGVGMVVAAVTLLILVSALRRVRRLRRAIPTGIPVAQHHWGRWVLRLFALGFGAAVVLLVVTRPTGSAQLGHHLACPFSPWAYWRHGYPITLRHFPPWSGSYIAGCVAAAADRWHAAWVLGIGALALLVGSLLPSPYRDAV